MVKSGGGGGGGDDAGAETRVLKVVDEPTDDQRLLPWPWRSSWLWRRCW